MEDFVAFEGEDTVVLEGKEGWTQEEIDRMIKTGIRLHGTTSGGMGIVSPLLNNVEQPAVLSPRAYPIPLPQEES